MAHGRLYGCLSIIKEEIDYCLNSVTRLARAIWMSFFGIRLARKDKRWNQLEFYHTTSCHAKALIKSVPLGFEELAGVIGDSRCKGT
jgi:hypothetical protein